MNAAPWINKHNVLYSSYYSGELYTHTPMALSALEQMGACEKRLKDFYHSSVSKLEPKTKPVIDINASNWTDHLGKYEHEASFVRFFKSEIQLKGQNAVMKEYFDALMPGVGAAAFHPLIRLYYAVHTDNQEELAISLATWAASYLNLELNTKLRNKRSTKRYGLPFFMPIDDDGRIFAVDGACQENNYCEQMFFPTIYMPEAITKSFLTHPKNLYGKLCANSFKK